MLRILLALLGVLLTSGCGPSIARTPTAPRIPADDTSLGAGDVFDVRVYGEEALSTSYRVNQDGTIRFPFVGDLQVAGRQAPEVAELITAGLRDGGFIRDPQVSVLVTEVNSKLISVVGAVRRPGNFQLSSGLTVVQAVSLAGGFTNLADEDSTVVTRRVDESLQRYNVPVRAVTRGRADDFPMQAGDIVYVPERVF